MKNADLIAAGKKQEPPRLPPGSSRGGLSGWNLGDFLGVLECQGKSRSWCGIAPASNPVTDLVLKFRSSPSWVPFPLGGLAQMLMGTLQDLEGFVALAQPLECRDKTVCSYTHTENSVTSSPQGVELAALCQCHQPAAQAEGASEDISVPLQIVCVMQRPLSPYPFSLIPPLAWREDKGLPFSSTTA